MTMIKTHQLTFGISVIQIIQLLLIMTFIIVVFSLSIGAYLTQVLLLVQVKTTELSSLISKQVNMFLSSQLKPKTKTSSGATTCPEKSAQWIAMVPVQFFHLHQKVFSLIQIVSLPLQVFALQQTRHICQNGSNSEQVHPSDLETNLFLLTKNLKVLSQFITAALTKTSPKECKSLTTNLSPSQPLKSATKKARTPKMITI